MQLTIQDSRPYTDIEWDTIWKECDYATYFHSREWAVIWQEYTKGRIRPAGILITFSDNRKALLPVSCESLFFNLIKRGISSPAGTFGGWLSLDPLSELHGNLICDFLLANYRNMIWRLNPYDPLAGSIKIESAKYEETQVLMLERNLESILKDWTKGHTSAVRKAQKAGVMIREALSTQDWKDYFAIYEDSLKRWGSSTTSAYGWHLFRCILELNSPNVKLWLAVYQARVISGALCFYAKRHVVYWHGASLSDFFHLRPVNLLLYEVIKHACDDGYRWFDFNPSGGHEGVMKFKRSFGTRGIPCPVIIKSSSALNYLRVLSGKNDSKKGERSV